MQDDTTWFWQIVDARGLADVSSDEFVALKELVAKAARATTAESERDELLREKERLEKERDEARDQAQALLLEAVAGLNRATELAEIVEMFRSRVGQRGEWDDGCFYHNGTSASELQEPLRRAKSVLENGPAGLADANSKSPAPSSQSERIAVLEAAAGPALKAVERLANTQMNISLEEWGELSAAILAALALEGRPNG